MLTANDLLFFCDQTISSLTLVPTALVHYNGPSNGLFQAERHVVASSLRGSIVILQRGSPLLTVGDIRVARKRLLK